MFYQLGKTFAFEKLGMSRWARYLRGASGEARIKAIEELSRLQGTRPPFYMTPEQFEGVEGAKRIESIIKYHRDLAKAPVPEYAPYLSPEWRTAMRDIKAGRMTPLESGLSDVQAQRILQYGPSSPINQPFENMSNVLKSPWYRQEYDVHHPIWDKLRAGLWASPRGTERTYDYARRAAGPRRGIPTGMEPVSLEFELPESIASRAGGEYAIPRDIFTRWARKPKIQPL